MDIRFSELLRGAARAITAPLSEIPAGLLAAGCGAALAFLLLKQLAEQFAGRRISGRGFFSGGRAGRHQADRQTRGAGSDDEVSAETVYPSAMVSSLKPWSSPGARPCAPGPAFRTGRCS